MFPILGLFCIHQFRIVMLIRGGIPLIPFCTSAVNHSHSFHIKYKLFSRRAVPLCFVSDFQVSFTNKNVSPRLRIEITGTGVVHYQLHGNIKMIIMVKNCSIFICEPFFERTMSSWVISYDFDLGAIRCKSHWTKGEFKELMGFEWSPDAESWWESLGSIQHGPNELFGAAFRIQQDCSHAFAQLQHRVYCPFAKKAVIIGAPKWDVDFGFNENLQRCIPGLTTVAEINMKQDGSKPIPDGYVIGLRGTHYGNSVNQLALTAKRVLHFLSERDPTGRRCMSEKNVGVADSGWRFSFGGCGMFVSAFAPIYPSNHSRHQFGLYQDHVFILFQPDHSFVRRSAAQHAEGIRSIFAERGQKYSADENAVVKPIDELSGEVVKWWDLDEDLQSNSFAIPDPFDDFTEPVVLPPDVTSIIESGEKWLTDTWSTLVDTMRNHFGLLQAISILSFDKNPGITSGCKAIRRFMARYSSAHAKSIKFGVHGAPESSCVKICDEGFLPAFRNIQTYGPGEYFSAYIWEALRYSRLFSEGAPGAGRMVVTAILCVNDDCRSVQGLNLQSRARGTILRHFENYVDVDPEKHFLLEQLVVNNPLDLTYSYCLPIGIATFGFSNVVPTPLAFKTSPQRCASPYSADLGILEGMGFQNRELNLSLLKKFDKNLDVVIEYLLSPDLATENLLSHNVRQGPSEPRAAQHEACHDSHSAEARENDLLLAADTANMDQLIKQFSRIGLCIDTSRLTLGPLIGEGASSKVFQAEYMREAVAVKQMLHPLLSVEFLREVELTSRLRHGFVMSIRGICFDPAAVDAQGVSIGICLILQLAQHGSIFNVLSNQKTKGQFKPWGQRMLFLSETASGLDYLHSQSPPIVHRDIKPGNILVTENFHPLISDFGLSCILHSGSVANYDGTQSYMAPELLGGDGPSRASDVYAFGMLMWFIATAPEGPCFEPWAGKTNLQVMELVERGVRPKWPEEIEHCSSLERFMQLTNHCWHQEPEQRPNFGYIAETLRIMSHEFPQEEVIRLQATTSRSIANELAQVSTFTKVLSAELEDHGMWNKIHGGVKQCTLDLIKPLSPIESRVRDAIKEYLCRSSRTNSTFQERYELRGAAAILSNTSVAKFAAQVVALSERAHPQKGWDGSGVFHRNWQQQIFDRYGPHDRMTQSDEDVEWRLKVAEYLDSFTPVLSHHPLCKWVRIYTVFHACSNPDTARAICKSGFAPLASLDPGFYAQGLYFTLDLDYAVKEYGEKMLDSQGNVTVLVCEVAVGNVYPVIEHPDDPLRSLKGRPQVPKYDTHFAVVEKGPCTPCPLHRWNSAELFTELVVFESAAILPRFILSVRSR